MLGCDPNDLIEVFDENLDKNYRRFSFRGSSKKHFIVSAKEWEEKWEPMIGTDNYNGEPDVLDAFTGKPFDWRAEREAYPWPEGIVKPNVKHEARLSGGARSMQDKGWNCGESFEIRAVSRCSPCACSALFGSGCR